MGNNRRDGIREKRTERRNRKEPKLGYYLIVTDTKGTERVYFNGLRDSLTKDDRDYLVIKVDETDNKKLVDRALEFQSKFPQYARPCIAFDKDQLTNFDTIIEEAKSKGIFVAWSNPCLEVWLHAYYDEIPSVYDSVKCCNKFGIEFEKNTGQKYDKADEDLYKKICRKGNEENAISRAENRLKKFERDGVTTPSKMVPCTTVHILVKEIRDCLKKEE